MADDEYSRSSAGDGDEDFVEDDNGVDYEATLDEEEALNPEDDYSNELKELADEGEMSIEELRKKYGLPPDGGQPSNVSTEDEEYAAESQNSCESTKIEASGSREFFDSAENEAETDDDKDYVPVDYWRKEPRVEQTAFQAEIPELMDEIDETPTSYTALVPLWSPSESLSHKDIDEFLLNVIRIRRDHGQFRDHRDPNDRDDEDALCALYRHNFDVKETLSDFPYPRVNHPIRTIRPNALCFDSNEQTIFEQGILTLGKDFEVLRTQYFSYREMGELIEFYYEWKKTPRYPEIRTQRAHREAHPHLVHPDHYFDPNQVPVPVPAENKANTWIDQHDQQSHSLT